MAISEEWLARKLCELDGWNPDTVEGDGSPLWKSYDLKARKLGADLAQDVAGWQPDDLRVRVASKIVGHIYTSTKADVGPATTYTRQRGLQMADEIIAMLSPAPSEANAAPDPLSDLVARFSNALLKKLRLAQANGRSGWERDDWEDDCRRGMLAHIEKGDPRDVAAYCAFMWHHGWVTASPIKAAPGVIEHLIREHITLNRFNENEDGTTVIDSGGLVLTLSEALYAALASPSPNSVAVRKTVERCIQICLEEAAEWDSDNLQTYKNYAGHCANRISDQVLAALSPSREGEGKALPPDWKQDQAETSRLPRKQSGETKAAYRRDIHAAMLDAWNTICIDTGCHPLDLERRGGKLFFTPKHWADLVALYLDTSDTPMPADCDWPDDIFRFVDESGEHDPCYVVMPGGAMLPLNHHAGEGVDIARAKFIVAACNAALSRSNSPGTNGQETACSLFVDDFQDGTVNCRRCGCAPDRHKMRWSYGSHETETRR